MQLKLDRKKLLRQRLQLKRNNIPVEKRAAASTEIAKKFLNSADYKDALKILIFFPFRSEVDTTLIIKAALESGKKIILPKVEGDILELYYVEDIKSQLQEGAFGVMEPVKEDCKPALVSEVEIAVIPGLCFDKSHNRMGYGGGFYDRLLPALPEKTKKIALCFNMQVFKKIPCDKHDVKIDIIITEKRTYSVK